jgi:antitoxin (DNA-binding transcriptional repressor) of toxin-antitoxin stability system
MKRAKVSELKSHLSAYLASVRGGESVLVCDRQTPIAQLVPLDAPADDFKIEEALLPAKSLKSLKGVDLRKRIDVVALLREGRDQR